MINNVDIRKPARYLAR